MKIYNKRAVAAGITVLLGIFLSWLGGYNFDYRGINVAYFATVILAAAGFAASFPYDED
jgi:hypothetical protein